MKDKRIWVTGAHGFLGKAVTRRLFTEGYRNLITPSHDLIDLRDHYLAQQIYQAHRPNIVIHLAASVGGIGANQKNPGKFFYDNLLMGMNIIEGARQWGVEKIIVVGSCCSYPRDTPVPFKEADLWNGFPEETNAPYGIAKKALLTMLRAYREQYGLNGVYLIPSNLYGYPGDNFDAKTSHVIPALIRKCVEAVESGADEIEVWGTGATSREFLYVDDAAEAIVLAMEKHNDPEPINVGSGYEIWIDELAPLIANLAGFTGKLKWLTTKPNGQPRRALDTSRAREILDWQAKTKLVVGLRQTIDWYKATRS